MGLVAKASCVPEGSKTSFPGSAHHVTTSALRRDEHNFFF